MRIRIFGRRGDLVGDRGGRPMRQAGIAVEPPQAVHPARDAQHQKRRERRGGEQEEGAETDRAPDRRQPQPEAKPGDRQEQADHGGDRRQRRPQPLPENRPARATRAPAPARRRRPAPARGRGGAKRCAGSARPGTDRSSPSPAKGIWPIADINTQLDRRQRAKGRHPLIKTTSARYGSAIRGRSSRDQSQGGRRSSAIRSATSRRGRTSAHSASRTSTSGTSGRVL